MQVRYQAALRPEQAAILTNLVNLSSQFINKSGKTHLNLKRFEPSIIRALKAFSPIF
jgi:hypothetical protein